MTVFKLFYHIFIYDDAKMMCLWDYEWFEMYLGRLFVEHCDGKWINISGKSIKSLSHRECNSYGFPDFIARAFTKWAKSPKKSAVSKSV